MYAYSTKKYLNSETTIEPESSCTTVAYAIIALRRQHYLLNNDIILSFCVSICPYDNKRTTNTVNNSNKSIDLIRKSNQMSDYFLTAFNDESLQWWAPDS